MSEIKKIECIKEDLKELILGCEDNLKYATTELEKKGWKSKIFAYNKILKRVGGTFIYDYWGETPSSISTGDSQ